MFVIVFFAGLTAGAFAGIAVMTLLTISSKETDEERSENTEREKQNNVD